MLYFQWDEEKAQENRRKHRIGFEAASAALEDPFSVEEEDLTDQQEQRLRSIGMVLGKVIVLVVHVDRTIPNSLDQIARIISARKATPAERKEYDENRAKNSGNASE